MSMEVKNVYVYFTKKIVENVTCNHSYYIVHDSKMYTDIYSWCNFLIFCTTSFIHIFMWLVSVLIFVSNINLPIVRIIKLIFITPFSISLYGKKLSLPLLCLPDEIIGGSFTQPDTQSIEMFMCLLDTLRAVLWYVFWIIYPTVLRF